MKTWLGRLAFVIAAVASVATSELQGPRWTYSESSDPQSFAVDMTTPNQTFDIEVSTTAALSTTSFGQMTVLVTADPGSADVLAVVTSSTGDNTAAQMLLDAAEPTSAQLFSGWLVSCDDTGCTGNGSLSVDLSSGDSASGTFEVTAEAQGPSSSGDEVNGAVPDGAGLTITITAR